MWLIRDQRGERNYGFGLGASSGKPLAPEGCFRGPLPQPFPPGAGVLSIADLVKLQNIVCHADQRPLASHLGQPAQEKLPESARLDWRFSVRVLAYRAPVARRAFVSPWPRILRFASSAGTRGFPPSNIRCPPELLPVSVRIVPGWPRPMVSSAVYRWPLA